MKKPNHQIIKKTKRPMQSCFVGYIFKHCSKRKTSTRSLLKKRLHKELRVEGKREIHSEIKGC